MSLNNRLKWGVSLLALAMVLSCGSVSDRPSVTLSGQVDFGDGDPEAMGPVFVAILSQSPVDSTGSLSEFLIDIQSIDKDQPLFNFRLTDKNVTPGDSVYLIAFADNNFSGGIPNPDTGDIIGYYLDQQGLSPAYVLHAGENSGIDIAMTKEIFDFESSLSGEISGTDSGTVTVFAYAGDLVSLDFTQINPDDIVGFTRFQKGSSPAPFSLPILPYGRNIPMENVLVFAFLDTNGNGVPDGGDRIGFAANAKGLPLLLTVDQGHVDNLSVDLTLTIPEPSGYTLSMEGQVSVPQDMDVAGKPLFILVVRAGDHVDLSALAQGNLDDVVFFYRLPPDSREFDFDLSNTDLAPGDQVMVLAVCDLQYEAGFPDVTVGDYLGYYQDRSAMDVNYTLVEGPNHVETAGDTDFNLNRIFYEHDASIRFELDDQNLNALNPSVSLDPGEHVTVVAVYKDGVTISGNPRIDMDYILGFGSVTVPESGNDNYIYSMDLLLAMDRRVPVQDPFAVNGIYVFAIFDGNTNGAPGQNNFLGYYWRTILLFFQYPKEIAQITDGINLLDQTVTFTTDTM